MKDVSIASFIFCLVITPSVCAHELEIWLAKSDTCNSCDIYRNVAATRNYGSAIDHRDVAAIPIRWKEKAQLSTDILRQLGGDSGPSNADWDLQLTILVVERGNVLAFGNIAESSDVNAARISADRMHPPAHPVEGHASLDGHGLYREFFQRTWNLEFFVEKALGHPTPPRRELISADSAAPLSLAQANVVFWGSASTPLENTQFIPTRINQIKNEYFRSENRRHKNFVVLFGHGPDTEANDTSRSVDGRIEFTKAKIQSDLSADEKGLSRLLAAIAATKDSKNLLIHVGHSAPFGAPIWGRLAPITPEHIAAAHEGNSSSLVMVSGACYGGLFAEAVDCGFFAAHPQVWAAGCQRSAAALNQSDDYLRYFFDASAKSADANGDGNVTLEEAHWYASARVENHQITYSSLDALADQFFQTSSEKLPESMSVSELSALKTVATAAERAALEKMLLDLDPDAEIPLTKHIELNHQAQAKLQSATELTSQQRNEMTDMSFKLVLSVLARRLLYRSFDVNDERRVDVATCEGQSIDGYLEVSSTSTDERR